MISKISAIKVKSKDYSFNFEAVEESSKDE
jgi:hypothetical protein